MSDNYNLFSLPIYAGTVTISSTSYANMTDGASNPIQLTVTKQQGSAATGLLCRLASGYIGGSTTSCIAEFAVGDGTTDTRVARRHISSFHNQAVVGEAILTGHAAGSVTITGRVKVSAQSISFNANHSAELEVIEVLIPA